MYRCLIAAASAAVLAWPAQAQSVRRFPATALRGTLVITQAPEALLNGEPARLAPGLRIRNERNLLEMSGALVGRKLLVNYTFDLVGQVQDVWILSPEERERKPWPTTRDEAGEWLFDAPTQTWTEP